ncbi:MAG TPA: trypsin-like peptidase domain-containing protein [Usitatibacter sp.]|nr:trypsin-like peptidase domain-containing protein [Usitatibacter sp.]
MIRALLACLCRALPALALAAPVTAANAAVSMPSRSSEAAAVASAQFKAPRVSAMTKIMLDAPTAEKLATRSENPHGGRQIGIVRDVAKSSALDTWLPVEDGFVVRMLAKSEEALGIRVKLDLAGVTSRLEVRVQGNDGRVEYMSVDPSRGAQAWTPWTEGSEQMIEVYSPVGLDAGTVRVSQIVHFTESPFAKASASCTISTTCSTGDSALDSAMAERKKSVAKINFINNGAAFICTGTLINTERFPSPFFMTAHHCVNNQQAASSITTFWFYEDSSCTNTLPNPASEQVASGADLVMTNFNLDGTLLLLTAPPPAGAVYSGWNSAPVPVGSSIFSISHPMGDTSRWASGVLNEDDGRLNGPVQQFNLASLTRGFIEGGSSGSGLFTLANGSLQFRGTLLGTAGEYSCTNTNAAIIYGRFDILEPQIDQYIRNAAQAPDDAPNRPRDLFNAPFSDPTGVDRPLNERATTLALDNRRIDYVGDLDVYRFRLTAPAWVSTWTEGAQDTIGSILDSRGVHLETNDDWQDGVPFNFGITKFMLPGTYYVQVGHFEATGTGAYNLRMRADTVDTNYTALWWNPAENGWGLNISHQGNTLFGTLYTYGPDGKPTWYSMSEGVKQADGSYLGQLASTTGPAFNSSPWNANSVHGTVVGSMRLSFFGDNEGTLTYNVGSAQVTKSITKLAFGTPPACSWSASNRSLSTNFQDLWWGGGPESGWGVNLAHQGNIVFATLFTYDASGQPRWFVMSKGDKADGLATYTGPLYTTTGPAFNAVPFTPITAANNTQVGTMTFAFTHGDAGTMTYTVNGTSVTKAIQRLEFGAIKASCKAT